MPALALGRFSHVSNDTNSGASGLGVQLVHELVDAGFVGGDIVDADKITFVCKAAHDGFTTVRKAKDQYEQGGQAGTRRLTFRS